MTLQSNRGKGGGEKLRPVRNGDHEKGLSGGIQPLEIKRSLMSKVGDVLPLFDKPIGEKGTVRENVREEPISKRVGGEVVFTWNKKTFPNLSRVKRVLG